VVGWRSRAQHFTRAHLLCDDRHAIALLREARRAHGDEITCALSDDRFRRAVGPFEVMDEADGLPAFRFRAEIDRDFKNAGLLREQVVLALERLHENNRRQPETGARVRAAFEHADMDEHIA
jgi:hypothetical protein